MSLQPPPTQQQMIDPQSGYGTLPWIVFFNALFNGDAGNAWIPTFQNLTEVGGVPVILGRYYKISNALTIFVIDIRPPQGGNTSAVGGTTFCDNFPEKMQGNGVCLAVSGLLGGNPGMCDQVSNGIYPATWTTVTVPLTIIGIVEAQ